MKHKEKLRKRWGTDHMGLVWETLATKASPVCPDSVRPLLSTMVPDTKTGTRAYSSNSSSIANSAA